MLFAAAVVASSGCTSPLTGLALKEFLRESTASVRADYDADPEVEGTDDPVAADPDSAADTLPAGKDPVEPETIGAARGDEAVIRAADGPLGMEGRQLDEAISRSLERFARAPGADATAQALLVETLETADRADWPEIIDSFCLSLENAVTERPAADPARSIPTGGGLTIPVDPTASSSERPVSEGIRSQESEQAEPEGAEPEGAADRVPVASGEGGSAAAGPQGAPGSPGNPAATESPTSSHSPASGDDPESPESRVASLRQALAQARRRAPLVIANPCFASRVRGWAAVDRFAEYRFRPGQQVIVYLELENLVPEEDTAGAITRIDTAFRLEDASGGLVQEWTFPTVEDRSASPRTDFFARYFLAMPESAAAGPHRLVMVVTDSVAGKHATEALDLEIRPAGPAAAADQTLP